MTLSDQRILVGVILSPHGIKGNLFVKSLTSDPDALGSLKLFKESGEKVKINIIKRNQKNILLCSIEGIKDRTEAEELNKTRLFCDKSDFPKPEEDEFYAFSLIGLKIYDEEKNEIGKVKECFNFGAGDLIEVEYTDKSLELVPFTKEFFPKIGKDFLEFDVKLWKSKNED